MKLPRLYTAYGVLVLSLLGAAERNGWSAMSVDEMKNVPKSVRDNPGSYRALYGAQRHFGGK